MDKRSSTLLWVTVTYAGVIILGIIDWLTGWELNFFVFYFVPICIGAWFLGLWAAVTLAVFSALTWFGADALSGHVHSTHVYAVWNTIIRLISFLAIGWSVYAVQDALVRERKATEALRRALANIKSLEAFLPICARCKRIRNQQGEWQQLEAYIGQHSNTQFSHGYCPECAGKLMEEARKVIGEIGTINKKAEP
jgi:hypothetical protein